MLGRTLYVVGLAALLVASHASHAAKAPQDVQPSPEEQKLYEEFLDGYTEYKKTGVMSEDFEDLLDRMTVTPVARYEYQSRIGLCTVCNAIIRAIMVFHQAGTPTEEMVTMIQEMCVLLNIESQDVCNGVVHANADIFLHVLENKDLKAETVCSLLLQSEGCNPNDAVEWTLDLDLGKKPATEIKKPKEDGEVLTIVQFSDIHYDPRYTPGGNAVCGEPTCCRANQGTGVGPTAAGYWGDYRSCDMPWHAVVDALNQIKDQHEHIDQVYMTGDLVDHGVWETSRDLNRGIFSQFYTEVNKVFPDTQWYPILGNHEPHPLNVYAPPSITDDDLSSQWLYNATLDHWLHYLPSDVTETVLRGGYYTALAKSGLRIISLNNNVCYTFNWWLLDEYGTELLSDQLTWLAKTLLEAEKAGEKVHILTHIPPGVGDLLVSCSREFRKIIDRFANTVAAQFNGHTHNDEFHLFYALDDPSTATNVALNGGSGTTYTYLNPNYKVYKVDAATGLVLRAESWTYNITEANLNGEQRPRWYKLYDFNDAFGVSNLTPSELDKLVHRMEKNSTLLTEYHRFYVKDSNADRGCDGNCQRNHLCKIVTDHAPDQSHCQALNFS